MIDIFVQLRSISIPQAILLFYGGPEENAEVPDAIV